MSSANAFSLKESKICCLGKSYTARQTSFSFCILSGLAGMGDFILVTIALSQTSPGFYVSAAQVFFIKFKIVVCKLFQFGRV